jgi:anti-sigma factor RsiW
LVHYLTRRRIGAYLDGALPERAARATQAHLTACLACQREAEALRRLGTALGRLKAPREPDWAGFWQGIVRGVEDQRLRAPLRGSRGRRFAWRPRWTVGGALAAGLALSLTLWQGGSTPTLSDPPVVVHAASTAHPDGSVMVYSTPDKAITVVWVFDD